jgi:hypothetical protein
MVFLCSVVLGFITKPLTMIRLFAELFGHYLRPPRRLTKLAEIKVWQIRGNQKRFAHSPQTK